MINSFISIIHWLHIIVLDQDDEPENWQQSQQASPELLQALTRTQVKRQDHIYEFIVTESNHCQVLKVIQKVLLTMDDFINMMIDECYDH